MTRKKLLKPFGQSLRESRLDKKLCRLCLEIKPIRDFEEKKHVCYSCQEDLKNQPKITKKCQNCKKIVSINKFNTNSQLCNQCFEHLNRRQYYIPRMFGIYKYNPNIFKKEVLSNNQNTEAKKKTNSRKIDARAFVTFQCKPLILTRDNFECQLCKHNNIKNLHVHHILPVKHGSEDKYVVNPKNLITLCKECHKKAHGVSWKNLDVDIAQELIQITKEKETSNPTVLPIFNPPKSA